MGGRNDPSLRKPLGKSLDQLVIKSPRVPRIRTRGTFSWLLMYLKHTEKRFSRDGSKAQTGASFITPIQCLSSGLESISVCPWVAVCAWPSLKQMGPARQAIRSCEGPHTAESSQKRGGLVGRMQSACTICSCLRIRFPNHLLWPRLQELSCQTKTGNYPRLIYTFSVYVLIEV